MKPPLEIDYRSADGARSTLLAFDCGALVATAPLLLMMPAMGVRASFYQPLAAPLAAAGLRLASCDLRGHGRSALRPGRDSDFGFREMLELDWPAAVAAVKDAFGGAPLVLLGHSLGGKLSLLFAAANPGAVAGVVTVASCSVYWRAFPPGRRLGILALTQLAAGAGRLLGSYPGHRLGFAGHEARRLMSDWASQARNGNYRVAGSSIDYEAALVRMATPALLISIQGDGYAPASAVDHLGAKLPAAKRMHLDDPHLSALKAVHFRWVQQPQAVIDAIAAWLARGLS